MGSKESSFKKEIEIGEEISKQSGIYRVWTEVYPCVRSKKFRRTLFNRQFSSDDVKDARTFLENGIKILRQLRHPKILRYFDSSFEVNEVSLLTERVNMLDLVIDSQSPIEIHSGINNILIALIFLHEEAGIYHNNLCPSSIFVTMDGRWKLGGFECTQKKNAIEHGQHWLQSDFVRSIKLPEFTPPEDQQLICAAEVSPFARDVYTFGKLIEYVLPYIKDGLDEEIIISLESVVQLTIIDSSLRTDLKTIASNNSLAFANKLSLIIDFLENIVEKTPSQKEKFFSNLKEDLKEIPENVIARRLVSLLLSRYLILEEYAHSSLFTSILKPSGVEDGTHEGLLSEYLYRTTVIPEIIRIFKVHETSVRLALLAYFNLYMWYFNVNQLEFVLNELKLGMKDIDERIVSASMHAMADLVLVFGGKRVTGFTQTKLFADGTPRKSNANLPTNISKRVVLAQRFNEYHSAPSKNDLTNAHPNGESHSTVNKIDLPKIVPLDRNDSVEHDWSADWSDDELELDYDNNSFAVEESISLGGTMHHEENFKHSAKTDNITSVEPAELEKPSINIISREELSEPDYFAHMEPVLHSAKLHVPTEKSQVPEIA